MGTVGGVTWRSFHDQASSPDDAHDGEFLRGLPVPGLARPRPPFRSPTIPFPHHTPSTRRFYNIKYGRWQRVLATVSTDHTKSAFLKILRRWKLVPPGRSTLLSHSPRRDPPIVIGVYTSGLLPRMHQGDDCDPCCFHPDDVCLFPFISPIEESSHRRRLIALMIMWTRSRLLRGSCGGRDAEDGVRRCSRVLTRSVST